MEEQITPEMRQMIVSLCREAGDDFRVGEEELIDGFLSNHHYDDVRAAAEGDPLATIKLRQDCGLAPIIAT